MAQRVGFWRRWLARVAALASVTAVPVGLPNDGLVYRAYERPWIDKPWAEVFQEFNDAREAWRKNPLARRLVGLVTSYCVGNGISLQTEHKQLQRFLDDFWQQNQMMMRIDDWSDELSRAGEIFPVLFTNPVTGLSSVRLIPSCQIEEIEVSPDDYESEIRYKESTLDPEAKYWAGAASDDAMDPDVPLMLHYAVNRPVGSLRGESDLAPMLPWLRRYSRWLEDRVRLNASVRAFLWIVSAPARLKAELAERYRNPPEAGSVVITEKDAETWTAVTPNLHAADAEKDGRAIRWMIVAGGPGTALLDIGEGEDANQATGSVMQEQRRRFLRRRQSYLVWMLKDLTLHAYFRSQAAQAHSLRSGQALSGGKGRSRSVNHSDLIARAPDISPEDNNELAAAAMQLSGSLMTMANLVGRSEAFSKMALRLWVKFAGEQMTQEEFDRIIADGETATVDQGPILPASGHVTGGPQPQRPPTRQQSSVNSHPSNGANHV